MVTRREAPDHHARLRNDKSLRHDHVVGPEHYGKEQVGNLARRPPLPSRLFRKQTQSQSSTMTPDRETDA